MGDKQGMDIMIRTTYIEEKKNVLKQLNSIYNERTPLNNYAFSLYLFIERLHTACIKDEITDLFFLARDGKFLKELYDEFSAGIHNFEIRTHYLYISRSSIINSTLKDLQTEEFEWMRIYKRSSIYKFLKALQFSDKEIESLSINENIHIEYDNFLESEAFVRLKNNSFFKIEYDKKREQNFKNQNLYLTKENFHDAKKAAIVDVGWFGTIQDYLFQMCGRDELIGYYIGCYSSNSNETNKKTGLLFDLKSSWCPIRIENYNYEYLCVANHGSVYNYDDLGTPLLIDDSDKYLYEKYYKDIQQSIKKKFIDIKNIFRTHNIDFDYEKYVWANHAKMLLLFNRCERKIISHTRTIKEDNLIDIKPKKNIKSYLYVIKKFIILCLIAFRYKFSNLW